MVKKMKLLINAFYIIFIFSACIVQITSRSLSSEQESAKDLLSMDKRIIDAVEIENWEKRLQNSLKVLSCCILLAGVFFLSFKLKKYSWILIFFSLATYLRYMINTYQSVSVLKNIVNSTKEQPLSNQEYNALVLILDAFLFVVVMGIPEKLLKLIMMCTNNILTDALVCIFYVLLIWGYLFFIFLCFQKLINNFKNLLKRRLKRSIWIKITEYFLNKLYCRKMPSVLTIYLIKFINHKYKTIWKIEYVFIPIVYFIDVIRLVIWILYIIIYVIIIYGLLLFILLKKLVLKGILWISRLTSQRVMASIVRISLILALLLVVACNRYETFLDCAMLVHLYLNSLQVVSLFLFCLNG